jgi:hypothetical protein
MTLDLTPNAEENAARAAMINALASGHLPAPPPVTPSEAVASPTIHEATLEPALGYSAWQQRLFPSEKPVDIDDARAELRAAIVDRAAAAADVAEVAGELDRADAMLAQIEATQTEHVEESNARIADHADRLRDWIAAGSQGDRPACGGIPRAPALRDEAELAAARLARAEVASDCERARAVHAATATAVDRSRRLVLTAEAQALAARYEAALAALGELQGAGAALLALTLSGTPALVGLVRERLPPGPAPATGDDAAARWADYARRLDDDPDARLL